MNADQRWFDDNEWFDPDGDDGRPWYPKPVPQTRTPRERAVALSLIVVLVGGSAIGIVRSVQDARTVVSLSGARYFATGDRSVICTFSPSTVGDSGSSVAGSSVACLARSAGPDVNGVSMCAPGQFGLATVWEAGAVQVRCLGSGVAVGEMISELVEATPVRVGVLSCVRQGSGVTCTNDNGKGFLISPVSMVELTPS